MYLNIYVALLKKTLKHIPSYKSKEVQLPQLTPTSAKQILCLSCIISVWAWQQECTRWL